jgi:hypothetical protein
MRTLVATLRLRISKISTSSHVQLKIAIAVRPDIPAICHRSDRMGRQNDAENQYLP